jgi:hypothetical protein
MQTDTLYVVDGESSAASLSPNKRNILVWRDALYDGPVPAGLSLQQLSRVRARHWGSPGAEFSKRDRMLARFREFGEIVLWFGPTTLCQLSLIQLLDWFANQDRGKVKLTVIDSIYLGYLSPDQVAEPLGTRRKVTAAQFRLASKAWRAYTAPDPARLNQFLHVDSLALPELGPALLAQAREYPEQRTGLSRLEGLLLECLARIGPAKAASIVGNVIAIEKYGDTFLFEMLHRSFRANNQLVRFDQPFRGNFNSSVLALSEFGCEVLAGRADAIPFNGIDRWIGGVHLHGQDCRWRWSEAERQVIAI